MTFSIDLEPEAAGTGPRFPTLRLREKGRQFVGMLIDYNPKEPVYIYGTSEIDTWEGKPKTQDLLTLLVLEGTDCTVSLPRASRDDDPEEVDATPGMVVRYYIKGHNRWDPARDTTFWNVKKKHGRLQLGDVVRGRLDDLTKIGAGGRRLREDKKVIGFALRKPRPEETPLLERCFEEYQKLKAIDLDEPAPAASAATQQPAVNPDDYF